MALAGVVVSALSTDGQATIRDLHEQKYRTNRYTEITRAGFKAGIGADLLDTLVSATVSRGVGGLFAGVAATWWARRH